MNYEVKIKLDHALVICSEPFVCSDLKQSCHAGITAATQNGFSKLLFDLRNVTGEPTTMERFYLGEYLAEQVRKQGFCGKVAASGNEPPIDPFRFGETVAVNRGVYCKVTTDLDEALNWLGLEPINQHKSE